VSFSEVVSFLAGQWPKGTIKVKSGPHFQMRNALTPLNYGSWLSLRKEPDPLLTVNQFSDSVSHTVGYPTTVVVMAGGAGN